MLQRPISITLSIIICFALTTAAQQPRNIVFEGAGIRGIAYCGALQKMEENNWLQNVQRVGGTSAGAVTALTVSLGYTSEEIEQLIRNTAFKKLNDGNLFFAGGINRLKKYFGWYRNKKTDEWLIRIIKAKTGNADITFRQLIEKGFKELYVTGTSLNKQQLIIFSHETYPDMKIRDAVRISMSIPLYFEATFIDSKGNTFYHPKNKEGLDVVVDGGITGNFPIRMFDSTKYIAGNSSVNQFVINSETIGLRIDRDEQISKDKNNENSLAPFNVNSLKEYLAAFYAIAIENLNRQTLTKDDWSRTIFISNGNIAPRIRKMKKQEIELLINNGINGFNQYRSRIF
ncbi:MAG: patatin-like phospholipase family protein [Chitinophagaceae bacterium]|nr:patatin-like phospholipase family protein [Chitinophagaceae bacterium]